jgi:hypothetical protein
LGEQLQQCNDPHQQIQHSSETANKATTLQFRSCNRNGKDESGGAKHDA